MGVYHPDSDIFMPSLRDPTVAPQGHLNLDEQHPMARKMAMMFTVFQGKMLNHITPLDQRYYSTSSVEPAGLNVLNDQHSLSGYGIPEYENEFGVEAVRAYAPTDERMFLVRPFLGFLYDEFTLAVKFSIRDRTGGSGYPFGFGDTNGLWYAYMGYDTLDFVIGARGSSTSSTINITTVQWELDTPYIMLFTFGRTFIENNSARARAYVADGVSGQILGDATSGVDFGLFYMCDQLCIGGLNYNSSSSIVGATNASIEWAAVWQRPMPHGEVQSFLQDPFQMFNAGP